VIPQTGFPPLDWFLQALDTWGYAIVFGFTIFENLFVIGSFTPGETVVVAAAFVTTLDSLSLPLVWISSLVGTMIGSNVSYLLGRRAGLEAVRAFVQRVAATRIGRILRIDPAGLDEVEEHFELDGSRTVFFSRFAVGAKNFVPAVAGAVRMPVFWFEFHTMFSAMVYTSLMCLVGWFLGENFDHAMRVVTGFSWFGLLVLLTFLTLAWMGKLKLKSRRTHSRRDGDGV
jgi:membrane protein DedA with SNARE-associated domain